MVRRRAGWWNQPSHFSWLVEYLQFRGLLGPAKRLMATVCFSTALLPAAILLSSAPLTTAARIGVWCVAIFAIVVGLFWLTSWPTERQSRAIALTSAACIAVWSVSVSNPLLGLLSCTALAFTGAYLASFHTARTQLINVVLALTSGGVSANRIASTQGEFVAWYCFWLILLLIVIVPAAISGIVRAMGADVIQSDRDPLTGLFNRRGLHRKVTSQLLAHRSEDVHVYVTMVDLDQFKLVNDTNGHTAGDAALIAVADILSKHCNDTAILCRAGGEEFLVIDASTSSDPMATAGRVCAAIADSPHSVTASVGVTSCRICHRDAEHPHEFVKVLLATADEAMYEAKRNGGNQVRHRLARIQ
jgi:diguanylate cyclase